MSRSANSRTRMDTDWHGYLGVGGASLSEQRALARIEMMRVMRVWYESNGKRWRSVFLSQLLMHLPPPKGKGAPNGRFHYISMIVVQ